MLSAYPLRKCRTAAACKYAVWNEGAGNGLWAIQDVFYLNVEQVSAYGTAPVFYKIGLPERWIVYEKGDCMKEIRFGKEQFNT